MLMSILEVIDSHSMCVRIAENRPVRPLHAEYSGCHFTLRFSRIWSALERR